MPVQSRSIFSVNTNQLTVKFKQNRKLPLCSGRPLSVTISICADYSEGTRTFLTTYIYRRSSNECFYLYTLQLIVSTLIYHSTFITRRNGHRASDTAFNRSWHPVTLPRLPGLPVLQRVLCTMPINTDSAEWAYRHRARDASTYFLKEINLNLVKIIASETSTIILDNPFAFKPHWILGKINATLRYCALISLDKSVTQRLRYYFKWL